MTALLHLNILTPAEYLYEIKAVQWIEAQLADGGGIGIWPGHAPLLAETVTGPLCYADDNGEQAVGLAAGILQITAAGQVTIFTSGLAEVDGVQRPFPAAVDDELEQAQKQYGRLVRTLLTQPAEDDQQNDE